MRLSLNPPLNLFRVETHADSVKCYGLYVTEDILKNAEKPNRGSKCKSQRKSRVKVKMLIPHPVMSPVAFMLAVPFLVSTFFLFFFFLFFLFQQLNFFLKFSVRMIFLVFLFTMFL